MMGMGVGINFLIIMRIGGFGRILGSRLVSGFQAGFVEELR